ncbi:hypothetical protein PsorP6_005112 [Peronosclerospora sorghi]|uniref:Uncharacterized protein n=1 Tax=Peronosclerospora sorghi TaxID=230839 RepID=A0ACC0W5B6_9STRA|nr:hypothetical protein PsorP6_005112 [Peronosclerospora sorghi]
MLGNVHPQVKHNADEDLRRLTGCVFRSVLAYDELKQTNKFHAGDVASAGEEANPARVETEAEAARVEAEAVATRVEKEADGAGGEEEAYIACAE